MARPARAVDDDGFTLIELLVYMALLAVLMTIVGAIAVSGFGASTKVQSSSYSSNAAQLVTSSVTLAAREAKFMSAPTSSRSTLVIETTSSGERCRAWNYATVPGSLVGKTGTVGIVRTKSSSSAPGVPADTSTALDPAWRVLAVGASQLTTSGGFATSGGPLTSIFSVSGSSVTVALSVDTSTGAANQAALVTATSRMPQGTSSTCVS